MKALRLILLVTVAAGVLGCGRGINILSITGVFPSHYISQEQNVISITGSQFTPDTKAWVDGAACAPTRYISKTQLDCALPFQSAGAATVTVQNGSGTQVSERNFLERDSMIYLMCTTTAKLASYRVNLGTGGLTETSNQAPAAPTEVAVDPFNRSIALGNTSSVTSFGISPQGVLTAHPNSPVTSIASALGVVFDPLGQFIWLGSSSGMLVGSHGLAPNTAILSAVSASGAFPANQLPPLAVHPSGNFMVAGEGAAGLRSGIINRATGIPTAGTTTGGAAPSSAVFTPDGSFVYYGATSSIYGYKITSTSTGAVTAVPGNPYSNSSTITFLATDSKGRFLYAGSGSDIRVYTIGTDGTLAAIPGSPFTGLTAAVGMAIDPSGSYIYGGVGTNINYARINPATGALSEYSTAVSGACSSTMFRLVAGK